VAFHAKLNKAACAPALAVVIGLDCHDGIVCRFHSKPCLILLSPVDGLANFNVKDIFLYAVIVPVLPFSLEERLDVPNHKGNVTCQPHWPPQSQANAVFSTVLGVGITCNLWRSSPSFVPYVYLLSLLIGHVRLTLCHSCLGSFGRPYPEPAHTDAHGFSPPHRSHDISLLE
jgi:hypothetical protein